MRRFSAVLTAGALLFAGCSSGGVSEEVSTTTLFPAVVETTTTPPTTVPDSPTPSTTIPPPPTTTVDSPTPTTTPLQVDGDSPAPEPTPVGHALPFAPENDSFSFENFGGGEAPADLTVNMARRLYGDDQVCSDVTDNKCTPYPVILQLMSQANKSMRGGLCEGLAVLSLRLAGDLNTLASFQGTDTVAQLIKEDPALLSEIAYWYVTQFATEVQQEASSYLEMAPKELAEVLLYDFAESEAGNNHTGFTIGIYSEHGGHAVTPYRVAQTPTGYRIYIYDSNWPTSERWIDVDDDGWVYALAATNPTEEAEAWSGGTGTMELTPMSVRGGPFTCGFCPQEGTTKSGTLLTVAASGSKQMSLKIVTESGQRLGYYDVEGFVNEIPGATYRYLISGPSTSDPVLVFLPPDVETFTADVEEIEVPAPEADAEPLTEDSGTDDPEVPPEQEQEEPTQQKFSLLVLSEEKSVQIEATVEEDTEEEVVEESAQSLIAFSEESVEVAEIEEATVAIAVDALVVEVELDEGQQVAMVFAEAVSTTEPEMLELSIQDDQGEVLAEVEVDVSVYRVETATPSPDEPDSPIPEPVVQPVQIEITYDEVLAEVAQEVEEIEEWVASDAEYFQAVAEDRLEEVLGESYVEEIEEIDDWEPLETDNDFDLVAVILSVDDEYWEDEQWEEVDYDEEWFEAEEEEFLEFFNEEIELAEVFEFVEEMDIEEYWEDDYWEEWTEEELDDWEEWEEEEFDEEWEDPTSWEEWEEEFLEEEWEEEFWLDTEEEWDDWEDEFWPEEAEWCDECEEGPWDEEEWEEPELEEEWEEEWLEESEDILEEEWEDESGIEDEYEEGVEWEEPEEEPEPEPEPEIAEEQEVDEEEQETEEGNEEWPEDSPETEEEPTTEPVEEEPEPEEQPAYEVDPWEEPPVEEPEPEPADPEPEPSWDPYADCRGTSACSSAPGGFTTWEAYDQANDPGYYDDWGQVPEGYVGWAVFTEAVESGEVSAEDAGEHLPEEVQEVYIPPPAPVYVPTYSYTNIAVALQETISTSSSTVQTGTATTTNVTTSESGILTHNSNDGHWHLDTTTVTTTATTVTNTLVDTTTVVARTGTDFVSCLMIDGIQQSGGCSTQRSWNDNETTTTVGDAYTEATTTTASASATVGTEEGCAEGGWRGMGDWCIVQSSNRNDFDYVQFTLDEVTSVRIDAETNLTRAEFNTSNEAADPYIYLNQDNNSQEGDHSGDTTGIGVGTLIELDDDGGNDCGNTCVNPPSTAVDVDETPNITYCNTGGACSNGVPVIDNVSDQWDSRIVRTNQAAGDYVVRASVYNGNNSGWYRLTIEEVE